MIRWKFSLSAAKGVVIALAAVVVATSVIGCDMLSAGNSNSSDGDQSGGSSQSVFAAGYAMDSSGVQVPVYWLDTGGANTLSDIDASTGGRATAVEVSDGKVYIGGYVYNSENFSQPVYWVDTFRERLPVLSTGKNTRLYDIDVANGGLYAVGHRRSSASVNTPVLWVNNDRSDLPVIDEAGHSRARAVFVDG